MSGLKILGQPFRALSLQHRPVDGKPTSPPQISDQYGVPPATLPQPGNDLAAMNPLRLRFLMREALARVLPRNTPIELTQALQGQVDQLVAEAPTAQPLTLPDGRLLSSNQALAMSIDAMQLAAAANNSEPQALRPGPLASGAGGAPDRVLPPSLNAPNNIDPREKAELRKKIEDAYRDDLDEKWENLTHDKHALALMTPEEKAKAIWQMHKGCYTDREKRAVVDILESCTSRAELDQVIAKCNVKGSDLIEDSDYPPAQEKLCMLARMWGRDDLIPRDKRCQDWASQVERGILENGDVHGLDALGSDPARVDPKLGTEGTTEDSATSMHLYGEVAPGTRIELIMESSKRKKAGKPPLDFNALQAKVRAIMEDPSLSKDQKKDRIEALRNELGLSEDTMRELGTGRYSETLGHVQTDVALQYDDLFRQLMRQLEEIQRTQGANSAEALELELQIQALAQGRDARLAKLQERKDEAGELYKIPPSFWQRLGEFLKNVAGVVGKVFELAAPLLNFIPGGQIVYGAYMGVKGAVALAKGDLGELAGDVVSMAGPLGGAVGGAVGSVMSTAGNVGRAGFQVASGVEAAMRGDVLGMLGAVSSGLTAGATSLGMSGGVLDAFKVGTKVTHSLEATVKGIASGRFENIFGGLLGAADALPVPAMQQLLADPTLHTVLGHTQQGLNLFAHIRDGSFAQAFDTLGDSLSPVLSTVNLGRGVMSVVHDLKSALDTPAAQQVIKRFEEAAPFVGGVIRGDYAQSLSLLLGHPALASLVGPGNQVLDVVGQLQPFFQYAGKLGG